MISVTEIFSLALVEKPIPLQILFNASPLNGLPRLLSCLWPLTNASNSLTDCLIFAKRRTIVWKNGINKGKGKESKVNSKWDEKKVRAKLTELGFLGTTNSSTSTTEQNNATKKKKKTKKKDTSKISDEDIKKLKELKKLLDDGILTQEEFNSQKKKLLK